MNKNQFTDELITLISEYTEVDAVMLQKLTILVGKYSVEEIKSELIIYDYENDEALIQRFYINKKVQGLSERTLHFYLMELRKWSKRLGKGFLNVSADDIKITLAKRQLYDTVSAKTISNEMRVLSSFYTWMHNEEIVNVNPMAKIKIIKTPKVHKEAFEEIEIERMRSILKTSKDKAVFEILLSTGCRVSELVGIKTSEIKGDKLIVHGKGSKDRTVYLNARAVLALENYLEDRKDKSIWLFPRMISIEELTERKKRGEYANWYKNPNLVNENEHADKGTIEAQIRKLGRKVGVKAYPHKFRRTCATWALRKGMPIMMVSKMLGHESVETTQIYLDISDEELEANHRKYV